MEPFGAIASAITIAGLATKVATSLLKEYRDRDKTIERLHRKSKSAEQKFELVRSTLEDRNAQLKKQNSDGDGPSLSELECSIWQNIAGATETYKASVDKFCCGAGNVPSLFSRFRIRGRREAAFDQYGHDIEEYFQLVILHINFLLPIIQRENREGTNLVLRKLSSGGETLNSYDWRSSSSTAHRPSNASCLSYSSTSPHDYSFPFDTGSTARRLNSREDSSSLSAIHRPSDASGLSHSPTSPRETPFSIDPGSTLTPGGLHTDGFVSAGRPTKSVAVYDNCQRLAHAAKEDELDAIEQIIRRAKDPSEVRNKTATAVLLAARFRRPRILGCYAGNTNADLSLRDPDGKTALLNALSGQEKVDRHLVKLLVDRGANLKTTDNVGQGTVHYCVRFNSGDNNLIKFLLGRGAEIDLADQWGKTALWYAVDSGRRDAVVELLLGSGATFGTLSRPRSTGWWRLELDQLLDDTEKRRLERLTQKIRRG